MGWVPIRISLEKGEMGGIGISLERKGCPLDLLDPLDP